MIFDPRPAHRPPLLRPPRADLARTLTQLAHEAHRVMGFEDCTVALYDPAADDLETLTSTNPALGSSHGRQDRRGRRRNRRRHPSADVDRRRHARRPLHTGRPAARSVRPVRTHFGFRGLTARCVDGSEHASVGV
ncbi:MAG: hypothetical protein WKH64_04420 [Chloroflexia bacterium]